MCSFIEPEALSCKTSSQCHHQGHPPSLLTGIPTQDRVKLPGTATKQGHYLSLLI